MLFIPMLPVKAEFTAIFRILSNAENAKQMPEMLRNTRLGPQAGPPGPPRMGQAPRPGPKTGPQARQWSLGYLC